MRYRIRNAQASHANQAIHAVQDNATQAVDEFERIVHNLTEDADWSIAEVQSRLRRRDWP